MKAARTRLSWLIRIIVLIASLGILTSFFYPLWHYYFEAPQYPEGLAMSIWSYKLGGKVDLINGLNHYVGFMHLDAANFLEFKVLPIAIVLIALWGLYVVVRASRASLLAWLSFFFVFGIAALIDFYRWLYAFGHTVDPMAIIDIEGYTPPMFGSSQFMNFYILSYPGIAFYILIAGLVLGTLALALAYRRKAKTANEKLKPKSAMLA